MRRAISGELSADAAVPGRRGLQICLGLVWLLDAALQYQPFMFGPFFVTQVIQPATAGNPGIVANSVTWVSHVMLQHIAAYNAMFATIQLLIAVGFFCPPHPQGRRWPPRSSGPCSSGGSARALAES